MNNAGLKELLLTLSNELDGPSGPGSGSVILDALCESEDLERRIDPAEPGTS